MNTLNYAHVIAQLSAAKNALSTEAARLSSIGDKSTAKQLWAEEDLLVARIDVLMAEELAAQPKTDIFADFFEANKDFLAN